MTRNGKTLTADEGMILVNGDTVSRQIVLGSSDSAGNWSERAMTDGEKAQAKSISDETKKACIEELKKALCATDYKAIKYAEGWIGEQEYAPVKAERQAMRERINLLESSLSGNA